MSTHAAEMTDAQLRAKPAPVLYGTLAEFKDIPTLLRAAEKVRDAGFTKWESYSPFPVHGIDEAMGMKPTRLPFISLVGGMTGCLIGFVLVYVTNAVSPDGLESTFRGYDYLISGKPIFSLPANIPPIFELTILLSAFGAFFGMIALNKLPQFYHPVFKSERFARASQDRFFIGIEAADPKFDRNAVAALLKNSGATAVEEMQD
jgi:hypothetical protein